MNILAVGAHWDDIEIGCGLTLHRLKEQGHKVYGSVITNSEYHIKENGHTRKKTEAYSEGTDAFYEQGIIHLPTTLLPNQEVVYNRKNMQELEDHARNYSIDLVFTHWHGDVHTDHAAVWQMSRVAFRRVKNLLQYQSNSYFDNTNVFTPQFFWGFTKEDYKWKKKILSTHSVEWEYRKKRWEREIFDRESHWGFLCDNDYAEAFMVSRLLDNSLRGK